EPRLGSLTRPAVPFRKGQAPSETRQGRIRTADLSRRVALRQQFAHSGSQVQYPSAASRRRRQAQEQHVGVFFPGQTTSPCANRQGVNLPINVFPRLENGCASGKYDLRERRLRVRLSQHAQLD